MTIPDSMVYPAGQKAYSINPLNWKTDGTPADKSENIGACFTGGEGKIRTELKGLCGCYIDQERGALKVTDLTVNSGVWNGQKNRCYEYQKRNGPSAAEFCGLIDGPFPLLI